MCKFFRVTVGTLFLCHFYSVAVDASSREETAKKKWTILVYLNADNNLEDAGYEDIHEMEKVGSTSDVNVVVQFDYISPRGTKRLFIKKDENPAAPTTSYWGSSESHEIHSTVIEEMPEQDMGDAKVFSDFVTWGMKEYPAEHYMVIMWNHGSGWSKESRTEKGISYDDTSGNHITTNQLGSAIDEIVAVSGNRIDVLAFDACLMSMYEVFDPLAGLVDYVVGSEETIPWDGYAYDDLLKTFANGPDFSANKLVHDMVNVYGASYSGGSQGNKNVTLSAVDVSKIEMVKGRLNAWIAAIKQSGLSHDDLKEAARSTQSYTYTENKDLGDYVQNVLNKLTTSEVTPSARLALMGIEKLADAPANGAIGASLSLLKAINETVILSFESANYSRSTGVAIYLPAPYRSQTGAASESAWKYDKEKHDLYMKLKWAKTTDWTSFLDDLFL